VTFVLHRDPFTPYDRAPSRDLSGFEPMPFYEQMIPVRPDDDFRHRVGTKPLDPADWLPHDRETAPTVAMKRELLASRRDDVVALHPGGEAAAEEAAALVAGFVGAPLSASGIDALVEAALLVADDLTVLVPNEAGGLTFVAGVVCSPSRWRIAEKMGRDMLAVHRPVARYAEHIGAPVDTLLRRLTVDRPLWRSNWTLEDHPSLFQPDVPAEPLVDDPADLWVRMERETLRRLPATNGVLFTIRGFQQPLVDYVRGGADRAATLHALIRRLPDDVARYKSIAPYRERVLEWLERQT
jgi:hypothetical protein